MATKKTTRKTTKAGTKPAKKPAAKKPRGKTTTPPEAPVREPGPCNAGGEHKWKDDEDGRVCAKCLEPGDAKPKAKKARTPKADGKLSQIDAAVKVLEEAGEPLNTKQMVEVMTEKGYWSSPGGKTPAATLYSAILRELNTKGEKTRFQKTDRGQFALAGMAVEPKAEAPKTKGKRGKKATAEGGAA